MSIDHFANIGTRSIAERRGLLEEVKPPRLPKDKLLASETSDPKATFKPLRKINTPEQLKAELARQRKKHEPFMRDLAPALPTTRIKERLEHFQWRMETEADKADFLHTARGKGKWEQITVPHFGGPIGRATAYYRTEFVVTREMIEKGAIFVRFGAADYKAHVFVNSRFLGSHEGFFAPFEFECLDYLKEGKNVLLVRLENDAIYMGNVFQGQDEEGDKLYAATNLGWDDPELGWHHCPPGMGIYQDVFIEACAPMHVSDLWVRPLVAEESAEAWIEVWSKDRSNRAASFSISIHGQNFEKTVIKELHHIPGARIIPGVGDLQKPTDNQEVVLKMGSGANLVKVTLPIPKPRLWNTETPWLYQIQVRLLDENGETIDTALRQFGMRSFRQDTESIPRGRFYLNDKEIKLRGANTMGFEQQDVFHKNFEQLVDDILLAKICNMNFLRLTQRSVEHEVYDYCDRLGLMTQSDLPLFGCLRYHKVAEAIRQAEETERLVRAHPCNIVMSYINEPFPNAYGKTQRNLARHDMQAFFEAADRAVRVLNPDRVIKHVDGDYDPPGTTLPDNHCYCGWYNGHGMELGKVNKGYWVPTIKDWQYACGEWGAEGLDPADLMRRRYPAHWLPVPGEAPEKWTPSKIGGAQTWNFHFMWFATQYSLEDWVTASQRHQAWATRLFAERFRRDNQMVSFAIHLFIDAFPSGWMKTIMDCERTPKPAYFVYRDALKPLTVNIRSDRWHFTSGDVLPFEFWICNDTHETSKSLRLKWRIEEAGKIVFSQQAKATVEAMRSTFQGFFSPSAPDVSQRTQYKVRLALCDGEKVLADSEIDYEVHPKQSLPALSVSSIGHGRAPALLKELRIKAQGDHATTILLDNYRDYDRKRRALDAAVKNGIRLIFMNLPVGEYTIGGSKLLVHDCIMRPREYVCCTTGHPMVEGFEENDFKCWYDPEAGHFRPLLDSMFEAPDWSPVCYNGNGVWFGGPWQQMHAVGELTCGKGSFFISQLNLKGRTKHNPVAKKFVLRLLNNGNDPSL